MTTIRLRKPFVNNILIGRGHRSYQDFPLNETNTGNSSRPNCIIIKYIAFNKCVGRNQ